MTQSPRGPAQARVVAVVVAHDGARWLPRLLDALRTSTRSPDLVVGVDTGSRDGSAALLAESPLVDVVHETDRDRGFGAAVAGGLAAAASAGPAGTAESADVPGAAASSWVWLLHDDCAPAPDALERLLEVPVAEPDVAVLGCRVRAWPSGRRLLEVGVTITGTGHRETGLEPGEHDQGQYDELRDVLAVSSAGMLVRQDVWEALGGFDPALPLFRDDVDFGWRAAAAGHRVVVAGRAAVFHAEAASRGVRATPWGHPHRADRRAALFTVLANCRPAAVPPVYLRLLLGSLLRALGYLLAKLPAAAWDELCAAAAVLGTPWRVLAARRRRSQRRADADVRRLLPPWWTPYANGLDAALGRFGEPARETTAALGSSARRLRRRAADATGLTADVDLPASRLSRHPLAIVLAVLTLASLVAARGLLGSGFLQGGALLPAPGSARAWWQLYAESAHGVGMGSTAETAPYVALLAAGGTLLLGKAWLLVDVIMLLSAPLAGLGAWVAAGRLVRGVAARAWIAVAYGLVPVVTGAVTSGHLGTVVVAIVSPWVLGACCRLLGPGSADGWRSACAMGLWLSVAAAFAPVCWPVAAGAGVVAVGWLLTAGRPLRAAQLGVALLLPVLLLLPWSERVLSSPSLLLSEAGVTVVPGASVDAWELAFARVAAPGAAPWEVTAGVTGVAVLSLLRRDTRPQVAAAWVLVVSGLVAAAALAGRTVAVPGGADAYPWLGVPVVVASAGAVAAAGMAADGLGAFVGSGSFGWRQPLAAVAAAAGASAVVLGLGWWVSAAPHGALQRSAAVPLPAYMVAVMATGDERVLVLHSRGASVGYQVLAGDGLRLGDDSVLAEAVDPAVAPLAARLLSQSRPGDVRRLGALGIGYVVVAPPQNGGAVAQLDATAGLTRTSSNRAVLSGWQVDADLVRAAPLPAGPGRDGWLVLQAVLWLGTAVLAAPAARRRPLPAEEAA
ncbi:MAG: glycosyltransferase [Nocardioidaceae bacterium]